MEDNKIYQDNMECIKESNPYLWETLLELETTESEAFVDFSMNGEKIVGIVSQGRDWYFNSRYDAKEAAKVWAEGGTVQNYESVIIAFGFSNGMYVKELIEKYPDNIIIAYEPSQALMQLVLEQIDLVDCLSHEKLFLAVGEKGKRLFTEYVQTLIKYTKYKLVDWFIVPNYRKLFELDYLKVRHIYMIWMRQITLDRNTFILLQDEFAENYLANMYEFFKNSTIDDLTKCFQNIDREKRPAIIVSAGPSLDKNIMELKKARGKAFIIVVDTALKAVLRAGIIPDLTITIDPHKPLVLFDDDRIRRLPMIFCVMSNKRVIDRQEGKKIYFGDSESYIQKIYDKYEKKLSTLETGGSVACNAFSIAVFLGFTEIILVGQDLAYPNGKEHTKDAYDNEAENKLKDGKRYFEVEDIYGGKVLTEENMDAYRLWFETQIVRYPKLHVIDATEGGAKIRGTEIITLKEAIDRECSELEYINYAEMINSISKTYTEKELQEIVEQLYGIPNELKKLRRKIKSGIKQYEELKSQGELRESERNSEKIRAIAKKIEKINQWIDNKPEIYLIHMYNYKDEYIVQEEVYDIKERMSEELCSIAQNGIKMFNSYLNAMERLEKNLPKLYDSMKS